MVKAYLRYEHVQTFGVVASGQASLVSSGEDDTIVAPALEALHLWHVRKGSLLSQMTPTGAGDTGEVTSLTRLGDTRRVAAGHTNGSIRVWGLDRGTCETTLGGHKTAVTALAFSGKKSLLASGGKDSDIVLWDLVAESGLFRLKGHRNEVTEILFLHAHNSIVSCSKDATMRVWNLESQHCTQVVTLHRGEIWSMGINPSETCLITGSLDEDMLCFRVNSAEGGADTDTLSPSGVIKRKTQGRTLQIAFDEKNRYFGAIGQGKVLELYKWRTAEETQKKWKRKLKRKREKLASSVEDQKMQADDLESSGPSLGDEFELQASIASKHKIKSFMFFPHRSKTAGKMRVAISLLNNSIEVHEWDGSESLKVHALDGHGHRGDVRSLSISNDDSKILSCSYNGIKVWNARTGTCTRTCLGGYGLCSSFILGDNYAIVGTKAGNLELFDINSGSIAEVFDGAHEKSVWGISCLADNSGLVSVGGDGSIKFWDYSMAKDQSDQGGKSLTLEHRRTMKMPEDVLCVAVDPTGKYIAVGMIDSSVKVFFADSLNFYLSLYGHKLPVLCADISSDGTLIVTGSSDKNVKIWGMDFGDCHKSLFAHADSVTQVKFVPKTHYFFSTGKDKVLKYWDGDKFELLLELRSHHSEVWTLALSSRGQYLVTGSHDRSIRRWERTEEAFFLEEEKEKRLETMFDSALDEPVDERSALPTSEDGSKDAGASVAAGRKNQETVSAADTIIDALDISEHELQRISEHEKSKNDASFTSNPLLLGMSPRQYVLHTIRRVKSSDVEQALILLPFGDAMKLLSYCDIWLKDYKIEAELPCKIVMTLVRIHVDQINATPALKKLILSLQTGLQTSLKSVKTMLGTNMAAIQFMTRKKSTMDPFANNDDAHDK